MFKKTFITFLILCCVIYLLIPKSISSANIISVDKFSSYGPIIRLPDEIVKAPRPETPFECMRKNLYFEAANQGEDGMVAVANVVLNRTKSQQYPHNICDVIYQAQYQDGKIIKWNCQFTWYCDGKPDNIYLNRYTKPSWELAGDVAKRALHGDITDIVDGATHYHTTDVNPKWSYELEFTGIVGDHIFYR